MTGKKDRGRVFKLKVAFKKKLSMPIWKMGGGRGGRGAGNING